MLKIYGADLSGPANKVRFVANYLGCDYEYCRVSLRAGEHRKPEYLKLHPAGKVPVLDDGGFILYESDAIICYLAEKQQSALYPKDIKPRSLVHQWLDFIAIHVGGAMNRVAFNRVFAPAIKVAVDENSLKCGLNFLQRFLPVIDNQLGRGSYLTGDELTLAEFSLIATMDPAEAAQVDLSPYPQLGALIKKLSQEDFYTRCHTSYLDQLNKFMTA